MSETTTQQPAKIATIGKPVGMVRQEQVIQQNNHQAAAGEPSTQTQNNSTPPQQNSSPAQTAAPETQQPQATVPGITDDAVKAYFKEKGIEFDSVDELKTKLAGGNTPAAAAPELTAEEKKAQEQAREQRLIEIHLKRGKPVEEFTAMKQLATGDPAGIGRSMLVNQLVKNEGFHVERAQKIVERMHLTVTDEELDGMDEAERKEVEKERAWGLKQLEAQGSTLIQDAKLYLQDLQDEADEADAQKTKTEKHASMVEDVVKTFERKQTIDLGEYEGQQLGPIQYEVSDNVMAEVKKFLAPENLKQNFLTPEGTFNVAKLTPLLVRHFSYEEALRKATLVGQTKGINSIKSVFGSAPPSLGGNSANQTNAGKAVRAGKPVVGTPQRQT